MRRVFFRIWYEDASFGCGFALTCTCAATVPLVAVIVAVPSACAVTVPLAATVERRLRHLPPPHGTSVRRMPDAF